MPKTVDVQLVNPFLMATLDCMKVMGGLQPERRRLFLKTTNDMHGDVAGIIGLSNPGGKGTTGSLTVSFPDALARRIVSSLTNDAPESLSQEIILDGIGEVANMVAGGAKRQLAGTPYSFDISTPTLLLGAHLKLFNPPGTISIACEFAAHPDWPDTFFIEVATAPIEMK